MYSQRLTDIADAADVCLWDTEERRHWVSRNSGNVKLQPDGPNLGDCHGTVEHEIKFWREKKAWFGRGLGRGFSARGLCGISGRDRLGL